MRSQVIVILILWILAALYIPYKKIAAFLSEAEKLITEHGVIRIIKWLYFEAKLKIGRNIPGFVVVNLRVKGGCISSFSIEYTGLLVFLGPWINGRVTISEEYRHE